MNKLKTIIMMQLKDKIDFSFLKDKKQTIFKIVFSLLKFVVITAVIYVAFYLLSFLRLISLNHGIPTNFFSIIFGFMIFLSILFCTIGLTKSLYLSNDNQVLLTLPTSRTINFISKLIVYYIYELKRNVIFVAPLLFAYGLINGFGFLFFLWLVPVLFIITLLTVSFGALLSIPALFINFFFRKFKILGYAVLLIGVALIIWFIILIIGLIPENINIIADWGTMFWDVQDVITKINVMLPFLYYLTIAFVGKRVNVLNTFFLSEQIITLLCLIGIVVGVLLITLIIVRPLYFKMASKPFEYTKKSSIKANKNRINTPFFGAIKKELMINFRTSEKFNSVILTTILLPMSILLLNKIFGAMDTRLSGSYMTIAFNILLILLIVLSSNGSISKIYSEEGRNAYLYKTAPSKYWHMLLSKLVFNLFFISIALLIAVIIFGKFANLNIVNTTLSFLFLLFIYVGNLFWSATQDIMNPQTEQYATTGTHTNNPNETKTTIIAFLLSAIFAFITFFLISENAKNIWIKLSLIGLLYFGWNIYMFLSKIKVYYKEK